MPRFRIRKVTQNNGRVRFYPEYKAPKPFLQSVWKAIYSAEDRAYTYLFSGSTTTFDTLEEANKAIILFRKYLEGQKQLEVKEVKYLYYE